MQPMPSQTLSDANPYHRALAARAAMGPEELAAHDAALDAAKAERFAAALRGIRESTRSNRIRYSGIPEGYLAADLAQCDTRIQAYASALAQGSPESLMIRGRFGCGKTYSACAILLAAAARTSVRFTVVADFVRAVNSTYGVRGQSARDVFAEYADCGVLVLDDLGREVPREGSMAMLWELVNQRTANKLPTIYTSNYGGRELFERIAQGSDVFGAGSTLDRIKESNVVALEGESRRTRRTTA